MTTALDVIRWIDRAESEVAWWCRYHDRLTPQERRAISGGDYRSFRRPLPPAFGRGSWLRVSATLRVRLATVEPRKGEYRCIIDRVEDFRTFRAVDRRLHEPQDPELATTLDVGTEHHVDPPEPERIPHEVVKGLPSTERARRLYEEAQAEHRRAQDELPLAERLRRLEAAGPVARRQLRAIRAQLAEGEKRAGLRRAS